MQLTRANSKCIQLSDDRFHHFFNTDCSGRAPIVAALIEKSFQKGRDDLFLQSVSVYFPGTGAGENEKRIARRSPAPGASASYRQIPDSDGPAHRPNAQAS